MTISIPSMMVITGDGTMSRGQCLGLYSFDQEHGCYKQVATEENCYPSQRKSRFVYIGSDEVWYISSKPGKTEGWMYNTSKSKTLPLTGWMFWDGKKGCSDSSIKIQLGPLSLDLQCGDMEIHLQGAVANKWPKYGGVFIRTDKHFSGKPVFINEDHQQLHSTDDGDWGIGPEIGKALIKSSSAGLCPAKIKTWSYWTGEVFLPIDSTISCSKHSK